ncbi:NicO-domain-containing protein [Dendrothele bispora CBS 962.96]|uniref:Nickel/cobalt efflux system n=1 Tax=Dendrothele bispora (strain CBS 962.96) TaxID=1314807 RepID=A0A4S8MEP9_DENBC|nr:NicO-domain-containing protein [Dendrothele bispora CBS 962.96]
MAGLASLERVRRLLPIPRLTLFGRSLLLISAEVILNAICWAVAGVLFSRFSNASSNNTTKDEEGSARSVLGLAMLAWTLGLRHALDADHISAIDNATRGLLDMGQLPITCGLFFSLGHSTIVIVVNVAIAISTDIANRLDRVGEVGGIIGASISGSFLFIIAVMNSIFLWKIFRRRKRIRGKRGQADEGNEEYDPRKDGMLIMRIIGPVITFVDRPWKMYLVGVLFGFGFDTASSIALLAVSALAKKNADGTSIPSGNVVILPFLFTAGMTLVDSLDSILVLYSYSGFPEKGWRIFESREARKIGENSLQSEDQRLAVEEQSSVAVVPTSPTAPMHEDAQDIQNTIDRQRISRVKRNMMSGLSIMLTLMSILLAFSISLITIMALIGENCDSCKNAAEAEDGGGLAGRWWRGWAKASDNSGYIGAAIIGAFVVVVLGWYGARWGLRRCKGRNEV